jgi:hypothetical protein
MRPLCLQLTGPSLHKFFPIYVSYIHQIRLYLRVARLQLLKIPALNKLITQAAISQTLTQSANPHLATWFTVTFPAKKTWWSPATPYSSNSPRKL